MKQIAGLMVAVLLWTSTASAQPETETKQPAEVNEFTSVVSGIVEGFEALAKAADSTPDATPAAQQAVKSGDAPATAPATEVKKNRSLKNSAILIAGGAGLGAERSRA